MQYMNKMHAKGDKILAGGRFSGIEMKSRIFINIM